MQLSLLDILTDPVTGSALTLEANVSHGDSVSTGVLRSSERCYPIVNGIPRFVLTEDADQRQTEASFGFKWQQEHSYASTSAADVYRNWIAEKYGFGDATELERYLSNRQRVLDAGCGAGYTTSTWMGDVWCSSGAEWVGVDISNAVDVAQKRLGQTPGVHFVQADILQMPFKHGSFDLIFSEGVLHHTPSTERAIKSLAPLLVPGGEIMFYVYRKKGPIREFSDDFIRDLIADLPPEQAWQMLRPLTSLAKALSDLKVEVDVPESIPYLGIEAGRHDVQRLIYWHFMKLFWNDAYPFEENLHVNFDWYHPRYAHRQSEEEVRRWCAEAGLEITYFHKQESGFTVRGVRGPSR